MKYAFFPGCSLESTAWDFNQSTIESLGKLGVELKEVTDWVCCGSTPAHGTNKDLAAVMPALNLQKAQKMEMPMMASCASCYSRFRTANHMLKDNELARNQIEEATGSQYGGDQKIQHVLDVLVNEVGLKAIENKVVQPLAGLKVACYYGCLLTRPPEIVAFDNPENPLCMEELITALGGTPVKWSYRTECCGASQTIPNPEVVQRLTHRLLKQAGEAGADCMAVGCQMCQLNLDLGQKAATKKHGKLDDMPVLYITQLLGLALGLSPKEVGLKALIVSADKLLNKLKVEQAS